MLPAVDVRLIVFDVRVEAKLPATMLLCEVRLTELEPLTPPESESPPVLAVRTMSVALKLAPAAEVIAPPDRTLNVPPAEEFALKLVAPVFCTNTFSPAVAAFKIMLAAFTANLLLPARSPMLPAVDVIVKIPVARVPVKLPEVTSFWAARVIELEPFSAAAKEKPPVVLVSVMSCAVIVAPAIELTVPLDVTSNTVPAADGRIKLVELALLTKTVPVPPVNSDTSGALI